MKAKINLVEVVKKDMNACNLTTDIALNSMTERN